MYTVAVIRDEGKVVMVQLFHCDQGVPLAEAWARAKVLANWRRELSDQHEKGC